MLVVVTPSAFPPGELKPQCARNQLIDSELKLSRA
jgi:hypothetical protein